MKFLRNLFALALLWLAAAAPAEAAWLRAESPHFIVYGEGREADLRARVAELEDFDGLLRMLTGTNARPGQAKLNVYLVRGYAEQRQIWPRAASNVGGFYTGTAEGVLAVSDVARRGMPSGNEILFHEYAHHFLLQYFPGVYPAWYTEGFAEYLMTATFEATTIELGRSHPGRTPFLGMRWLEMEEVLWGLRREATPIARGQFYAQSWLLVHYLLRDPTRAAQLNRYLRAVNAGQEQRAAFAEAFAATPSQLQQRLADYRRNGFTFSRLQRPSATAPPAITIAALPPSAERLMFADVALRIADTGAADALLQRIRREARPEGDPYAQRVLARAEAMYGDADVAGRLLTPLLAAAPEDAELLYLIGLRHARNEPRTAAGWFARAYAADPNHFPAMFRHALILAGMGAESRDEAMALALRAHGIAPQTDVIRLNAAAMLARRERWVEAEALLAPLANGAHADNAAARTLLAKVRARDASGLAPAPQTE